MRMPAFALLAFASASLAEPVAAQSAKGVPPGTYQTTIRLADAKRMKSPPPDSMTGKWTLTFDDKSHVVVKHDGSGIAEALLQPKAGGRLFFDASDTGTGACKSPATYRFTVKGSQLTFRAVGADKCDGRKVVLTSHAFRRAS